MATCALCSATAKLEQSHVIPQFVYRGLKQPGGPTRALLCGECEDRFSLWESQFARDVFHPLLAGKSLSVKYGPWLSRFAASVCWRVLENARRENQLPGSDSGAAAACLKIWSDFLRGGRPDAGVHHLHLRRDEAGRRGFMSRHEAIASEVTSDNGSAWVYAQLGPLALIGLIRGELPEEGSGTRLHLEGKLKPRRSGHGPFRSVN